MRNVIALNRNGPCKGLKEAAYSDLAESRKNSGSDQILKVKHVHKCAPPCCTELSNGLMFLAC